MSIDLKYQVPTVCVHTSMFNAVTERPAEAPGYVTRQLVDGQGQAWQELDLQALVSEPEFLAIAA